MSGLLAAWNSQKPMPWQQMLHDLVVLGPDAQGDWQDPIAGLRLARTQLHNTPESCLEPPIVTAEGCVLVWEGRLDDRQSLLTGRTRVTDAQLLIESYRRWGEPFLAHLRGEFVFILWDTVQQRLVVGCDPTGIRTIAYFWDGQTLLLSSRAVTLLLHPQVSHQLDELYLAHALMNSEAQPPGSTPFQDIRRLLPGSILVLQAGHLSQSTVATIDTQRTSDCRSPEEYYEKFWHLLDQSVRDRLRHYRPACTTLSGGLDSTTITVALLHQLPAIDAFSIVTPQIPEIDEQESIQAFLQQYPQVNWYGVNCDDAWAFTESWQDLPTPDDPIMGSGFAMHNRLNAHMQAQGFGLAFEGHWGDELFQTSCRDLLRQRNWRQALKLLQLETGYYAKLALLWWDLILPRLPKSCQQAWFAYKRQRLRPFPAWINPAYTETAIAQIAIQQQQDFTDKSRSFPGILAPLSLGCYVGGTQLDKLMVAAHHMEAVSPLQDQRLLEFAFQIPTALQFHSQHEKIFLRRANRHTLPPEIRWRSKENYADPMQYHALGQGQAVLDRLEQIKQSPLLTGILNYSQVTEAIQRYRHAYATHYAPWEPLEPELSLQLHNLFVLHTWHQQVQNNYGRAKTHQEILTG